MRQQALIVRVVTIAIATFLVAMAPRSDAQAGIERKTLLKQDLAIPGYETMLVEATLNAGVREGKHFHSGSLVIYILEGELTFELGGQPPKVVKAGDSLFIAPGQVHEGINKSSAPAKVLATFITEKGKPLTTPAP